MSLFLSTYINKVDKKGRVSVPANFRAALGKEEFQGVVVYSSFVNECIEACGMQRMARLSDSIDNMDPYSAGRDAFATTMLGGSFQLPFDGEGRIILPEALMQEIGVVEQAVFVGKGATFEIWAPAKFEQYANAAKKLAKQEKEKLRLSPNKS